MSSACDSCPSKDGCTSQASCPSAIGKDPLAAGSSVKTVKVKKSKVKKYKKYFTKKNCGRKVKVKK